MKKCEQNNERRLMHRLVGGMRSNTEKVSNLMLFINRLNHPSFRQEVWRQAQDQCPHSSQA